jgi:hypothetical protein
VPTATATTPPAPTVIPPTINPADYLINGTPNVPDADGIDTDGYGLGLGLDLQADPNNPEAGWAGCSTDYFVPPADLAESKVLPDGATLAVDPFSCHVLAAVATCTFNDTYDAKTGTITMGMNVASFSQT